MLGALLLCVLHGAQAWAAQTPATTALDRYLGGLTTWSADFRQSVIDGRGRQLDEGQGRLVIVRPGKFRWESTPAGAEPGAQVLIADGRNLWFVDRDLQQATVRPLSEALPQSPAMLLAGGADLRAAFDLRADGRRDGLDWVRVLPRDARSDFREAAFGFQGEQLLRMIVIDKLGQRSTLVFSRVARNQPIDPQLVTFVLPKGVDLIGKPAP
jgi:outer membrane lipoprotein carrier protein